MTPKQRMLNAYRGIPSDRPAVAPEFWYYYPAKLLGVDMAAFRKIPFHQALKTTFTHFDCEGWGVTWGGVPVPDVTTTRTEVALDADRQEVRHVTRTPFGTLTSATVFERNDAAVWEKEHPVKDLDRDLPAYAHTFMGGDLAALDPSAAIAAWKEVGDSYLLEYNLGPTFFDFVAPAREGGFEQGVCDFTDRADLLEPLQERYIDHLVRRARALCEKTPFESFFMGCCWSCLSLLSPAFWRKWDKPVLAAVAAELHRHGRLLHHHFHGRCLDVAADFPEIGIDCVCVFERPPGGDVVGLAGLKEVARRLQGRTAMNGNVQTVDTLIRGTPEDARREVGEILEAFAGNPRVIVGTGDQVGRETPEANLRAMIETAKKGTAS
jgi:hypothetical protein